MDPPSGPPTAGGSGAGSSSSTNGHGHGSHRPGSSSGSHSHKRARSSSARSGTGATSAVSSALLHSASGLFSGVAASRGSSGSSAASKELEGVTCPICFEMFKEAHVSRCGHSFCQECIKKCLKHSPRCPKCNTALDPEGLFPNFAINEMVAKIHKEQRKKEEAAAAGNIGRAGHEELTHIWKMVNDSSTQLALPDIHHLLKALTERKETLQTESSLSHNLLLKEFLEHIKQQKTEQLMHLQKELNVILGDLENVERNISALKEDHQRRKRRRRKEDGDTSDKDDGMEMEVPNVPVEETLDDGSQRKMLQYLNPLLEKRRKRMHAHFDDLCKSYLETRLPDVVFPRNEEGTDGAGEQGAEDREEAASLLGPEARGRHHVPTLTPKRDLDTFSANLNKFTRYHSVRPLATLSYTADLFNNSSIVSSIEFDKDNDHFAIAGVTKRIKIYDYNTVLKDIVDIHYPTVEMTSSSKISCVAWSHFYKSSLVSSDYEGTVSLWDTSTATRVKAFTEHQKRCWSVDFNQVDTKMFASGSDDACVKLWSAKDQRSVASLESRANVCCVKFNPASCYHLAFGSADHCVHYYDLRATKVPLSIFKGHKKAVSYVKFLNAEELVSASTDSQLKLWSVGSKSCRRSFQGHINEKNFVGLATDGDYITCGSENNSLYVYYKGLTTPLFSFKFGTSRDFDIGSGGLSPGGGLISLTGNEDSSNDFVSAVCWRRGTNCLLVANSQGTIKILEMV